MAKLRVMLVDDGTLFTQGVKSLLNAETDIEIVAEVSNGDEAVRRVAEIRPDVVLMEIELGGLSVLSAIRQVRKSSPETKIIVLTDHDREDYLVEAIAAGASGYMLKDNAAQQLTGAIRDVGRGHSYLGPRMVSQLVDLLHGRRGLKSQRIYQSGLAAGDARIPVFQMKLGMSPDFGVGWELADEGDEGFQSFSYTIPWQPAVPWPQVELVLFGDRKGAEIEVPLELNGSVYTNSELQVRFALHDPLAPSDFRGIPFLRAFPYVGAAHDVLDWYGVSPGVVFVPLAPLDLIQMDQLFTEQGLVFVGVTQSFGPHASETAPSKRVTRAGMPSAQSVPGESLPAQRT